MSIGGRQPSVSPNIERIEKLRYDIKNRSDINNSTALKEADCMKKNLLWKILLVIGFCPFLLPVIMSVTRMSMLSFADWLLLWSVIYWPTYIIGLALIIFTAYKLKK